MDSFTDLQMKPAQQREAEHGGVGPISFRRLMDQVQFNSGLDFVDFTVVPPGSSIGKHFHSGSEEFYFIVNGEPLICVNGRDNRGKPGTLSIVRSGEWHSLINDTNSEVTILVVQARVRNSCER
jgi:mannose-6-phosphate isomerase-like protein (cupin superfamily)